MHTIYSMGNNSDKRDACTEELILTRLIHITSRLSKKKKNNLIYFKLFDEFIRLIAFEKNSVQMDFVC